MAKSAIYGPISSRRVIELILARNGRIADLYLGRLSLAIFILIKSRPNAHKKSMLVGPTELPRA